MDDCDELIEGLHAQARDHVYLAATAPAVPVAEMHIDLAVFSEEQAGLLEELCDDR